MNEKPAGPQKKILLVSPDLEPGGAQRQMINIANGLHRGGHEALVFLFRDGGKLRNSLDENVKALFPCYPPAVRNSPFLQSAYGTISLLRAVMTERPDILYSRHWPKIPVALIGRMLKVKTVSGEGNNLEQTFLSKRKIPLFYMRRLCVRLSDEVVANSRSLGREVKEAFGLNSEVRTIYNGIDIEDIRKKSEEKVEHVWFGTKIPVIVAVGFLRRQKGFPDLLRALEIVNRARVARLIIIGNGSTEELRGLSRKLSLEDKTDFLGAMENPFPYISNADVFVCSSLYEGLSNVILEALALGKPVISTNHKHGADEIIENRKNGILVPTRNPREMADAIIETLENEELRKNLGKEAKKRSEYFSRDKMISEYEKLFAEM